MLDEVRLRVQKEVDRHYKLYKDVASGKQLKEDVPFMIALVIVTKRIR